MADAGGPVVGVDGGATKTDAVVMSADGRGARQRPRRRLELGERRPRRRGRARSRARSTPRSAEAGCARGESRPRPSRWPASTGPATTRCFDARAGARSALGGPRLITNDAFAALRAGISGSAGCVSSAGTGAVAAGRNEAGETARTMARGLRRARRRGRHRRARASGPAPACARRPARTRRSPARSARRSARATSTTSSRRSRAAGVSAGAPSSRRSCSRSPPAATRWPIGLLEEQGRSLADEVLGVARRLRMLDTAFELVIAGSVHLAGSARARRRLRGARRGGTRRARGSSPCASAP